MFNIYIYICYVLYKVTKDIDLHITYVNIYIYTCIHIYIYTYMHMSLGLQSVTKDLDLHMQHKVTKKKYVI